ncbi:MAG: hypothetical protein DRI24_22170, partial [Deltaproteobacteria bacterium]
YNNMSVNDQLNFLGAVNATLGRDSAIFFDQLRTDGSSTSQAIAGQAMAHGDRVGAKMILQGNEIKRKMKGDTKELRMDLTAEFRTIAGTAFRGNSTHRKALEAAYIDAYLGLAQNMGYQFDTMERGSAWYEFKNDPDISAKAFEIATGGIVEFNDVKIAAPGRNVTQGVWDGWIDGLTPARIEAMGGTPNDVSSEEFLDRIEDGTYRLEDTDKPGRYVVRQGVNVIRNNEGNVFFLDYDGPTYVR